MCRQRSAGSTTHLPCALNASDDTEVHSCPAGHQAEEQVPLDSAWVVDVRCDVQSLPVPKVAHSAAALALLYKSWSQDHCYRLASESGDNPRYSLTTTHELQAPAWQTLELPLKRLLGLFLLPPFWAQEPLCACCVHVLYVCVYTCGCGVHTRVHVGQRITSSIILRNAIRLL